MMSIAATGRQPLISASLPDQQGDPCRPGLTAEEEHDLAARIAAGDDRARDRLVQANLTLVARIARAFLGRGLEFDDLIGEGNLGLIRAADRFDPRFGTRFSTYANYWIKQAIREALLNSAATIRLPAHIVGLLTRWRRAEKSLGRELGRSPRFDEVAAFLGLSESQRGHIANAQRARRLRPGIGRSDEDNPLPIDDWVDPHEPPSAVLEAEDECQAVLGQLDRLDDRERITLALRYGLEGDPPLTLREIGDRLGVSREYAGQLERRAIRKLEFGVHPRHPSPTTTRRGPRWGAAESPRTPRSTKRKIRAQLVGDAL